MIKVVCTTNLDLFGEVWPDELPTVPRVGDSIESATEHKGFRLRLEVVSVTWNYNAQRRQCKWYPIVELHIPKIYSAKSELIEEYATDWSITDFYNWYAPKVGKPVSYFI